MNYEFESSSVVPVLVAQNPRLLALLGHLVFPLFEHFVVLGEFLADKGEFLDVVLHAVVERLPDEVEVEHGFFLGVEFQVEVLFVEKSVDLYDFLGEVCLGIGRGLLGQNVAAIQFAEFLFIFLKFLLQF